MKILIKRDQTVVTHDAVRRHHDAVRHHACIARLSRMTKVWSCVMTTSSRAIRGVITLDKGRYRA